MLRVSRFSKFVLGLFGLFTLLTGGLRYATTLPDQNACVRMFRAGYESVLFQLGNPNGIKDRRVSLPPSDRLQWYSPDKRYVAYDYPWPDSSGDPVEGAALYVEDLQTGNRVRLHPVINSSDFSTIAKWSPNGQWIASVWVAAFTDGRDGQYLNLLVSRPDGNEMHTISWKGNQLNGQDHFLVSGVPLWSADSQYIAINGIYSNMVHGNYHIFSIPALSLITTVSADVEDSYWTKSGFWSPTKHYFVAVQEKNNATLSIVDPDNLPAIDILSSPVGNVVWSPDSDYFIIYPAGNNPLFAIYSNSGNLIHESEEHSLEQFFVAWMRDGRALFKRPIEKTGLYDLVAYDINQKQYEIIATHVEWDIQISPNGTLIISRQHDGKTSIELIGDRHIVLVENAAEVMRLQWDLEGTKALAIWRDMSSTPNYHLTWANFDGSDHHNISGNANFVFSDAMVIEGFPNDIYWLEDGKWIFYETQDTDFTHWLNIANLQTGEHRQIIDLRSYGVDWEPLLSPDHRFVMLNVEINGKYVLSLEDNSIKQVSDEGTRYADVLWSPDSKMIAYVHPPTQPAPPDVEDIISVVTIDGKSMGDYPVHGLRESGQGITWTKCD
jgi:hypothetical protein